MELWRWIELLLGTGLGCLGNSEAVPGVLGPVKWLRRKRLLTGKVRNVMGYQPCPAVTLGMIKPINLQSHSNDSYRSVTYGLIWDQRHAHNWSSKVSFFWGHFCPLVAHGLSAQHLQQNEADPCAGRAGHFSGVLQHLSSSLPHPTRLGLDRLLF